MNEKSNNFNRYNATLTGELLLFEETKALANLLAQGELLESVIRRNAKENLIMHKREKSIQRINTPLRRRLEAMSDEILRTFLESDEMSSKLILLYIICKTDRLVRDFVEGVYGDKIITRSDKITRADIEKYFESVYSESEKILNCSDQTKAKLKQTLMKILADAGLVVKNFNDFNVIRPLISEHVRSIVIADGGKNFIIALGGTA